MKDWLHLPEIDSGLRRTACADGHSNALVYARQPDDIYYKSTKDSQVFLWGFALRSPSRVMEAMSKIVYRNINIRGVDTGIVDAVMAAASLDVGEDELKEAFRAVSRLKNGPLENRRLDHLAYRLIRGRLGQGNPVSISQEIRTALFEHVGKSRDFDLMGELRKEFPFELWLQSFETVGA